MGIEEELAAMTKSLGADSDDVTAAPGTESPGTELPGTEAPTTEVPSEDSSTEAPGTESASTDAPTTEVSDEMAQLRAEIELLKSQNKPASTESPGTNAPSTEAPIIEEDFLDGVDLEEIMSDPVKFNALLNSVYKKGVRNTRDEVLSGTEGTLKSIPDIVKTNIAIITSLKKASEEFYDSNEDLKPFKKVVAAVFEEISAANPDKTYVENLNTVGDEVRSRLELQKKAVSKDKNKSPKLPVRKGQQRQQQKPETKGITSEIDAMNKSLEQ